MINKKFYLEMNKTDKF